MKALGERLPMIGMHLSHRRVQIAARHADCAVDPANNGPQSGRSSETGLRQKAYARSDGAIWAPMLSPMRDPDAFMDSFARWAYRAVV